MICKERDAGEHPDTDRFSKAGAVAEEKMAFYLRRAFVDEPDIMVFNDLRFRDDSDDRAQIDHLVLHRNGFVVVESKSVSTKVKVNEHGEWMRLWNNHWQGMESPVQQTKFQIEFLKRALNAYCEELVGKMLRLIQTRFWNCPMEVIVAISDRGTIKRGIEAPEVVKADQVPDRIREIIRRHKKARSLLPRSVEQLKWSNMDGVYNFTDEEMAKISEFLVGHHYPLSEPDQQKKPATVKEEPVEYAKQAEPATQEGLGLCEKCGAQCMIKWGHNYYWRCPACDTNMPIKEHCPSCRTKMKLRKDRQKFFIRCEPCGTEELYCEFSNE